MAVLLRQVDAQRRAVSPNPAIDADDERNLLVPAVDEPITVQATVVARDGEDVECPALGDAERRFTIKE